MGETYENIVAEINLEYKPDTDCHGYRNYLPRTAIACGS